MTVQCVDCLWCETVPLKYRPPTSALPSDVWLDVRFSWRQDSDGRVYAADYSVTPVEAEQQTATDQWATTTDGLGNYAHTCRACGHTTYGPLWYGLPAPVTAPHDLECMTMHPPA